MKIQVLVATMNQQNIDKYNEMNLQSNTIIANQCDKFSYLEKEINEKIVRMVSTKTKGLSRNRNIAMSYVDEDTDIIIFTDDDVVFNEGYEQSIIKEFTNHPNAEAIKFNMHIISDDGIRKIKKIDKFEKATMLNISSDGVCGLAIKKDILLKYSLHFHEYFGAGTKNYCGEDTIFMTDLIKKGIKFYKSPIDIAGIYFAQSTWFTGNDEKRFETAGMVLGTIFPLLSYLLVIRSAYRFSKRDYCNLNFWQILKCYYKGRKKHV